LNSNLKLLLTISKNMKVLYVEDNEQARAQTLKLLQNYFTDITIAEDGQKGLDKFKNNLYHIIFSDIEMPVMDGITMIKCIREIDTDIPIVIFSAHEKSKYFLEAIKLGIDGYILKPYKFEQVSEIITKVIMKFDIEIKSKSKVHLKYDYIWDKSDNTLSKDDKIIKLTKNETKLLQLLAKSANSITSSENIESFVFLDEKTNNKMVINLISRLQIKLDANIIDSIYGIGYRLKI